MNDADRALAELARRQRQVFTRQQATAAGLGRSAFTRRVRGGLFVPVGSHTFTFAGVADLDSVLADAGVQSGLERRFRALTKGRGYPLPTTQRVYRHKGVHVARVDFDFAPLPIIVEVGGRRGYLSSAERQRQERRRNSLQLLGKVIYFFTTEDVFDDPAYVLDTLDACLRRAA